MTTSNHSYIQTFTGKRMYFDNPTESMFDIESIARGLSREGRFANQLKVFYSVAQHSCAIAKVIPLALHRMPEVLLHDGTEAYLRDIASPIKSVLPDYHAIEKRMESVLFSAFKLQYPLDPLIKHYDLRMLVTEAEQLFVHTPDWLEEFYDNGIRPLPITLKPLSADAAYTVFMHMWNEAMFSRHGFDATYEADK